MGEYRGINRGAVRDCWQGRTRFDGWKIKKFRKIGDG
jgi:hypothetical protein